MAAEQDVLGILGGLGPEATVAFMSEIIALTPAEWDQDHIEMVVYNDPKVPDRNYPKLRDGDEPLPRLIRNASRLEGAGADLIVIASNTTHRYYDEIAESVEVPMPNMISLVRRRVGAMNVGRTGVLTTTTAADFELFDREFSAAGVETIYPNDMDCVMDAIYAFKQGEPKRAQRLMDDAVAELSDESVDVIILGCTEFSALNWNWDLPVIDAATVLAEHCIDIIC